MRWKDTDWKSLIATVLVAVAVAVLGSAGCLGKGPHLNPWYGDDYYEPDRR